MSPGHLDAVIRMVEADTYCPDLMKQLSAVQGSLERASRIVVQITSSDAPLARDAVAAAVDEAGYALVD